jgi:hypothetical protein
MPVITFGGHIIRVECDPRTGRETVHHDGLQVSMLYRRAGATHVFPVREEGELVSYEVNVGLRLDGTDPWYTVKRQGQLIYSDV